MGGFRYDCSYPHVGSYGLWTRRGAAYSGGSPWRLDGAGKFRSKDPTVSELFMGLAFIYGRHGCTVEAVHLWSADNHLADDLSRGVTPPSLPVGDFVSWTNPTWRIATTAKQ